MARPLSVLTLDQTQVDFPILKIVVPQIGHCPFVACLPFFMV